MNFNIFLMIVHPETSNIIFHNKSSGKPQKCAKKHTLQLLQGLIIWTILDTILQF